MFFFFTTKHDHLQQLVTRVKLVRLYRQPVVGVQQVASITDRLQSILVPMCVPLKKGLVGKRFDFFKRHTKHEIKSVNAYSKVDVKKEVRRNLLMPDLKYCG